MTSKSACVILSHRIATSLAKVDTELSADCIEFCPIEGFHDIFVCGTYQVLSPDAGGSQRPASDDEEAIDEAPKPTNRTGRLLLYRVGDDKSSLSVAKHRFVGHGADSVRVELQRITTPAILDAKWLVKRYCIVAL